VSTEPLRGPTRDAPNTHAPVAMLAQVHLLILVNMTAMKRPASCLEATVGIREKASGFAQSASQAPPAIMLSTAMGQVDAHTDLPHGAKIFCNKATCLDHRCDRVVANTFGEAAGHLGAPKWLRSNNRLQNWRFHILPTADVKNLDGHYTLCIRDGSKREQRTRNDHLRILEEVLQFQVDHEGRLPTHGKDNRQERNLRMRYDRVKSCGECGLLERIRLQWSEAHAGPVGKYLLGKATRKGKSFRSNAARNYQAVRRYMEEQDRKIQELYDEGSDLPQFSMGDLYWFESSFPSDSDQNENILFFKYKRMRASTRERTPEEVALWATLAELAESMEITLPSQMPFVGIHML
jgi:hypothetical protein